VVESSVIFFWIESPIPLIPDRRFRHEFFQRFAQAFQRPRGVVISARLERIFPFQLEQRADRDQHFRNLILIHAPNMKPSAEAPSPKSPARPPCESNLRLQFF